MSDEIETQIPKGDPLVKFCPLCSVEYSEPALTNRWFRCDSCEQIIQCKVKSNPQDLQPDDRN